MDLYRTLNGLMAYLKGNNRARKFFEKYAEALDEIQKNISSMIWPYASRTGNIRLPIFVRSSDGDEETEQAALDEIAIENHMRDYILCQRYGECLSFARDLIMKGESPGWEQWLSDVCPKRENPRYVCYSAT